MLSCALQVADPFMRGQSLIVIGDGTAVIDMADVDSVRRCAARS